MNIEDEVFRHMMRVYPHELYAQDPERFWRLYSADWSELTREQMEQALKDTES